jgi:hypothetical protein
LIATQVKPQRQASENIDSLPPLLEGRVSCSEAHILGEENNEKRLEMMFFSRRGRRVSSRAFTNT